MNATKYESWRSQFAFNITGIQYDSEPITIFLHDGVVDEVRKGNRVLDICKRPRGETNTVITCPELPPREFGFFIREPLETDGFVGKCNIKTKYLETEVSCTARNCHPQRTRRSQKVHPTENWTVLDIWSGNTLPGYNVLTRFFMNFVDAFPARTGGSGGSNALVGFLLNPSDPFSGIASFTPSARTLSDLSNEELSRGLAQSMNTYWITQVAAGMVTGANDSFATTSQLVSTVGDTPIRPNKTATASVTSGEDKVVCNIAWLIVFTVSTIIALASSIAGLVLVVVTKGPRLAMNVSTVIRDSPWVSLPMSGSYLDDSERSRKWMKKMVRLVDVAPQKKVGHVAIAYAADDGCALVDSLRADRLYD